MSPHLSRTAAAICNQPFPVLVVLTMIAGTTLSNGIIYGSVPVMAAGAALSAVFPWSIVAAWLIQRWRRRVRDGDLT